MTLTQAQTRICAHELPLPSIDMRCCQISLVVQDEVVGVITVCINQLRRLPGFLAAPVDSPVVHTQAGLNNLNKKCNFG